MNSKIVIRSETDADVSAITEVTVAAFKALEISNHTEQFIIAALRAAQALEVSLVAEMDGRVIGHIDFSPVTISDGTPTGTAWEVFFALSFDGCYPQGAVTFHEGFNSER
ncbi:MAG: GNAT family N-acetyltransferase [Nitrososphaerales archaeon]